MELLHLLVLLVSTLSFSTRCNALTEQLVHRLSTNRYQTLTPLPGYNTFASDVQFETQIVHFALEADHGYSMEREWLLLQSTRLIKRPALQWQDLLMGLFIILL